MPFTKRYFRRGHNYKKIVIFFFIVISAFIFLNILIKTFKVIFKSKNIDKNDFIASILENNNKSIFNIKELNIQELEDRIILLNVYTIKDFSYIFSLEFVKKLENKYKNKITIIDIITDDFELNNDNIIINYIIKNNIKRPILNIDNFNISNSPDKDNKYFVLVDGNGVIRNTFFMNDMNDLNEELLINDINELLLEFPKSAKKQKIEMFLEKNNNPESFIKSLSHIKYVNKVANTNNGPYFIISDSKGKKIYLLTLNGLIVSQIGSGTTGSDDKQGINATFCYPSGMTISENRYLYVADMCNDSIRKIDLNTLEVSTLIDNDGLIKKPNNVELLGNNLIISTGSTNKLINYNLKNDKITKINCLECDNILKLLKFDNKVYFISINNYGLYSIDNEKNIKKEIDFEELNKNNHNKISGTNNFHIDETGLYFIDKFNNNILKIKDGIIKNYSNNIKNKIYNLPTDIVDVKDKLYLTNENNKKLITLDKNTKETKVINISFGYEYNKIKNAEEEFLNVNDLTELNIKNGKINEILINLENGYSFEEMAPQSLSIFKEDKKNNIAILIKSYTKAEILENKILKIPELDDNSIYYIKGNFYYCNLKKQTPCLIKNYYKRIITNNSTENTKIIINFLY